MQSDNHDKVILRIHSSAVQQGIRRALAHPTFSQGVPVAKKCFGFFVPALLLRPVIFPCDALQGRCRFVCFRNFHKIQS